MKKQKWTLSLEIQFLKIEESRKYWSAEYGKYRHIIGLRKLRDLSSQDFIFNQFPGYNFLYQQKTWYGFFFTN